MRRFVCSRTICVYVVPDGSSITTTASYDECSETITSNVGTLRSPDYPNDYPANARCEWRLQSQQFSRITLTFDFIDIPGPCAEGEGDYVEVYSGQDEQGAFFGRLCGDDFPNFYRITLPSNQGYVRFRSDGDGVQGQGFEATFTIN